MPYQPYYDEVGLTGPERDELIVRLRGQGLSLRQIAKRVGMSSAISVSRALDRIAEGRPARGPRA